MKILTTLNPEHASKKEVEGYGVREAARAVVVDTEGNVALLHVSKKGYYKLPGGGIDSKEDVLTALARECQEEIGCDVEVLGEVGTIVEYRKIFNLKQISHCYFAKVLGAKGSPEFTAEELQDDFKVEWLPYEKALGVLKAHTTDDFEGSAYIVPRDISFLEASKEYIKIGQRR